MSSKFRLISLTFATTLLVCAAVQGDVITIDTSLDLDINSHGTVDATGTQLWAGKQGSYYRAFFQFDLSDVDLTGLELTSATFRFAGAANPNGGNNLWRVGDAWDVETISYDQLRTENLGQMPTEFLPGEYAGLGNTATRDMVLDWLAEPETNYGVALVGIGVGTAVKWRSSEWPGSGSYAPQLVLSTSAIPEPGTVTLLALGALSILFQRRLHRREVLRAQ
ncbi:MAG: PEP-CTERM sorting domain-containing protein [Phycisphaerae bacterium]|nr:PEP-CTERM sorting domain-containing protein [Phycisphaerae bacterium]